MKLRMNATSAGRVFWVESTFSEKDAVKAAGFIWHGAVGCRPSCGACASGLGKVWWTRHEDAARRLSEHADDEVKVALGLARATRKRPAASSPTEAPKRKHGKDIPALLAAVLDHPDDLDAKQVYADWLLEQGDPRGELIRIQIERETATGARAEELGKIEKRLLNKHKGTWSLGPRVLSYRWRRGFIYSITVNETMWRENARQYLARHPIRRVRITGVHDVAAIVETPELAFIASLALPEDRITAGSLRRVVASPHVRRLRGLELSDNVIGDNGLEVLSTTPFTDLVELRLFGCAFGPNGGTITPRGISSLLAAPFIPRLRELDLRANTLFLDEVDPDGVMADIVGRAAFAVGTTLDLAHNHLDAKAAKKLIASKLPRLRLVVERNDVSAKVLTQLATRFEIVERERTSTGELLDDRALDGLAR